MTDANAFADADAAADTDLDDDTDADAVILSSNTRFHTRWSVPSSPGRSFLCQPPFNCQSNTKVC